jgi:uncharacterized membrane protein (UPF0127 family)
MKKYWLLIFIVIVAAALAYALLSKEAHTTPMQTVTIGNATFKVEVVDTESLRELGLGNRTSLPAGQGMLFVFQQAGNWGFWMKDTEFPLDILWARADGTITTIVRNIATSTYPQVFYPKTPDALYVLEVNAGAAAAIAEGQKIVVQ